MKDFLQKRHRPAGTAAEIKHCLGRQIEALQALVQVLNAGQGEIPGGLPRGRQSPAEHSMIVVGIVIKEVRAVMARRVLQVNSPRFLVEFVQKYTLPEGELISVKACKQGTHLRSPMTGHCNRSLSMRPGGGMAPSC